MSDRDFMDGRESAFKEVIEMLKGMKITYEDGEWPGFNDAQLDTGVNCGLYQAIKGIEEKIC